MTSIYLTCVNVLFYMNVEICIITPVQRQTTVTAYILVTAVLLFISERYSVDYVMIIK